MVYAELGHECVDGIEVKYKANFPAKERGSVNTPLGRFWVCYEGADVSKGETDCKDTKVMPDGGIKPPPS